MTNQEYANLAYPEIYYKVQPYVMMMCDEMEAYGAMMPTHEMVEEYTDRIYDNVCKMYPDMGEWGNAMETIAPFNNPLPFGRGRRQRGPFRDLITILLLTEMFGRRRRYY